MVKIILQVYFYTLGFLGLFFLASCGASIGDVPSLNLERFKFSQNPIEMRNQLAGNTAKFDDARHGTQIEYFDPSGRAYLWYPGNRVSVPSEWKIEPGSTASSSATICFRYSSRSYNPVTRQFGGQWECRSSRIFGQSMTALIDGDEFDLSSGRIPRTMPRGETLSVSQVESLIGRSVRGEFLFNR